LYLACKSSISKSLSFYLATFALVLDFAFVAATAAFSKSEAFGATFSGVAAGVLDDEESGVLDSVS
jgi:hypothetical protein